MRDWSLGLGDPVYLTLAADTRLCQPDYVNDHIWELEIGSGEPAALAVRTTYGLRARAMRLFPRFTELGKTITNPADFYSPVRLRRFYPNFLWLDFSPFEELAINSEYWVPESHVLAGRLTLVNRTAFARKISIELCGSLMPMDGQSLKPAQQQMVNVLVGQTSGLMPILFMTGGPKTGPGPFPSLAVGLELDPAAMRQVTWVQAAADSVEASFELARHFSARPWEAERTRIELMDAAQTLEIHTGDPDWDAALAVSQCAAFSLFFPASDHLPCPSFVRSRQPDNGYSHKGDGQDHPPSWSGQSPLETYYLASLLPAAPQLARGLLDNFLAIQNEKGEIDNRPGLAGQRGKFLATPLLASLAWQLLQSSEDPALPGETFQKLLSFFKVWFSPEHDPDQDGLPQWGHLLETGFEDNPLFDVWHPWSQGVATFAIQDPALEGMLYHEASCLIQMSAQSSTEEISAYLRERAEKLHAGLEAGWNPPTTFYGYRSSGSGSGNPGKIIATLRKDSASVRPKEEFEGGVRLLIEVQTPNPAAKRPVIEIGEYVMKNKGEFETINRHQFQWRTGGLVATSQRIFQRIGRITAKGLDEDDVVVVRTVDTTGENMTLFLPLWARLPSARRAKELVRNSLAKGKRFDQPFGIPALPGVPNPEAEVVAMSVHLPWNHLIGLGLLTYGLRREAARLTARLMAAVIQNLKQNHAFYQRYHAGTGNGIGERGALTGLAPIGLFLETLGVRILSSNRVRLEGKNPFPWPVTITHKGLKVVKNLNKTEITFPNGKSMTVEETDPLVVTAI